MSSLLLDGRTLIVLPSLAARIGLNESIVLQQIHYWIEKKRHVIEGKSWVYNTYESWQAQFPFWSVTTIRRTLKNLEANGFLQTGNFNTMAFDQTKWYTINYDAIGQFGKADESKQPDGAARMTTPIPESNNQKRSADFFLSERNRFEQTMGKEKVAEAEAVARAKGITAWAYVRKILLNWEQEVQQPKKTATRERLPDWFGKEHEAAPPDADFERDRQKLQEQLAARRAAKHAKSP